MKILTHLRSNGRTRAELAAARHQMAAARSQYRSGSTAGHPEEALEEIERLLEEYRSLVQAVTDGRVLDWDAIDAARSDQRALSDQYGSVRMSELPESYRAEFDAAQKRVDDAWAQDLASNSSSKPAAA